MGASQSHSRHWSSTKQESRTSHSHLRHSKPGKLYPPDPPASDGYFLLTLQGNKVKVVNAKLSELNLLCVIIRRHGHIKAEGWGRNMTYTFTVSSTGRHCMIQLVADTLLSLYQNGWHPVTPVGMGTKTQRAADGLQATIYFKRKRDQRPADQNQSRHSGLSHDSPRDNSCICLETYGSGYLGFHEVPNTVLHDIVETIQREYKEGVCGVSMGVHSVICDYITPLPPVLAGYPYLHHEKFIQLGGDPWREDSEAARDTLQLLIIACLTKDGYKLSIDITMDITSRVFFFIRDTETISTEVLIPDMAKLRVGEYRRPTVVRSRSSFFRRTNSIRRRARNSLRRNALARVVRANSVKNTKLKQGELSWWQQASTDMSSDFDDLEDDCGNGNVPQNSL